MRSGTLLTLLACGLGVVGALQLEHRLLIITKEGWTQTDFLEDVLNGYGMPYDIFRVNNTKGTKPDSPRDFTGLMLNPDGSGKYSAYVMYPNLEGLGYLTKSEVDEIWDFARRTGARAAKFNAWPTGVGYEPTPACTSKNFTLRFTDATPMGNSGVKRSAALESGGVYMCPAVAGKQLPTCSLWANDFLAAGVHPKCNTSVILTLDANPEAGAGYNVPTVGGVLVNYEDGRELLAWMVDCASWSNTCLLLAHVTLPWLTRGIIPGERKAILTPHVDDMFLFTTLYKTATDFRINASELHRHAEWQRDLAANRLPAGSKFKLGVAWHGNGVLQAADKVLNGQHTFKSLNMIDFGCTELPEYKALGCDCWLKPYGTCAVKGPEYCRNCSKDWPKPLGEFGWNRMPKPINSDTMKWNVTEFKADRLFKYISEDRNKIGAAFNWIYHTFSHLNHENATYYEADRQIALNKNFSMPGYLNVSNRKTNSHLGIITPSTSGMSNGDVLRAEWDNGMRFSIGDANFPHMVNKTHPHHLVYTTKAKANFDGFALLPRQSVEVYVDVATKQQAEDEYNALHPDRGNSTLDQIMSREAKQVVSNLLKMKKDAYLFHQANLHLDPTNGGNSLLMSWAEAVAKELTRVTDWPVTSLKFDNHYHAYKEREARDACKFKTVLEIQNGALASVTVSRGAGPGQGPKDCAAPIVVPDGTTLVPAAAGAKPPPSSKLGNDPLTYHLPFAPASAPVKLAVAGSVPWPVPAPAAAAPTAAAAAPGGAAGLPVLPAAPSAAARRRDAASARKLRF